MNDHRLALLFRTPRLVETAVRDALAEALAARRMGMGEVDARSFGNRALAALEASLATTAGTLDALGRHEIEAATVLACARVFSSKLGRRVLTIEPARLGRAMPGRDASILDPQQRLHIVRIEACGNDAERVELGRDLARVSETGARSLHAPRVHLLSLRDGRLRSFSFKRDTARLAAA